MTKTHRINPRILKHARELRKPLTPPKALLWSRLRNRQLGGFKFRRQHPVRKYIVDFWCVETKLIIELDGDSTPSKKNMIRKERKNLESTIIGK